MSSKKVEAVTIEMFDNLCRNEILGLLSVEKQMHKPVWDCDGERFSEFECFFIIMIGESPGITVNDLQQLWGRTQGAVSQRLIIFEKRGLIFKKKSDKDRRYTEVLLTDKGKQICETVKRLKW